MQSEGSQDLNPLAAQVSAAAPTGPTVSAAPTGTVTAALLIRRLGLKFKHIEQRGLHYLGHVVRKHHQASQQDCLIHDLVIDDEERRATVIADYKMKQLHLSALQARGEMIGAAGISVHIFYSIFAVPPNANQEHLQEFGGGQVTLGSKDFIVVPIKYVNPQTEFHDLSISTVTHSEWTFHTCQLVQ